MEKNLFVIQLPANGSIYHKGFLDPGVRSVDIPQTNLSMPRFCVGPSTEYLWWYQQRDELSANRGPWHTSKDVLSAVGERELEWLQKFGCERYPREALYREFYGHQRVDPQVHIGYLLDYLKLAPHVVPRKYFCFRFGELTGIIDWEHATILPLFLQAKIPKHFQNDGDDESENFRPPKLRSNFDMLSDGEREYELEIYRRRQVHYFYVGFTDRHNKPHFNAMRKHNIVMRNRLYDTACRPWEGDNASLQAELISTLEQWEELAPEVVAPVQYSMEETKNCLARHAKQKEADLQMEQIRAFIGVNIEGWVPNGTFEEAKAKAEYIKNEMLNEVETEYERRELLEHWPFQDHEEID
ncbi:hypothetical protein GLAREA_04511 [Glarea lozoyensis ATCC 20868]|uniref:Aminoglycoside phosphotransferase domain-containing protein n=1 Tax=Glarea lozoyensis (strain ATCC 20868 / MF5171) TaxID=1116229 RepID=S3CPV4_GLAL2|nr:uncharacterized protein GLAREA_04511 [Glarea lozoyensis ATCC 20868]EPE27720.1 hypothetical protein GLAREA_04511 [Glarea lozoyensis ATCC 20868]